MKLHKFLLRSVLLVLSVGLFMAYTDSNVLNMSVSAAKHKVMTNKKSGNVITFKNESDKYVHIQYSYKKYKSYNTTLNEYTSDDPQCRIILKGVTYYKLKNSKYKTAITLNVKMINDDDQNSEFFFNNERDTFIGSREYIVNQNGDRLYALYGNPYALVRSGSSKNGTLVYASKHSLPIQNFGQMTVSYAVMGVTTQFNFETGKVSLNGQINF